MSILAFVESNESKIKKNESLPNIIKNFSKKFDYKHKKYNFITNGLFGYIAHEAVSHFEDLDLDKNKEDLEIPELYYAVYKYIISVSLFNHEAHIFCHSTNNKNDIEIIDKLLILSSGLPGNLVADNLDGIIINVFILFFI